VVRRAAIWVVRRAAWCFWGSQANLALRVRLSTLRAATLSKLYTHSDDEQPHGIDTGHFNDGSYCQRQIIIVIDLKYWEAQERTKRRRQARLHDYWQALVSTQ
jgi:hypothetical protein